MTFALKNFRAEFSFCKETGNELVKKRTALNMKGKISEKLFARVNLNHDFRPTP